MIKKEDQSVLLVDSLHFIAGSRAQNSGLFDPVFNNPFLSLLRLHTRCLIDYR